MILQPGTAARLKSDTGGILRILPGLPGIPIALLPEEDEGVRWLAFGTSVLLLEQASYDRWKVLTPRGFVGHIHLSFFEDFEEKEEGRFP